MGLQIFDLALIMLTELHKKFLLGLFLLLACATVAQQVPIQKGATELQIWAGGGSGLGHSDGTQVADAGFRYGLVLTDQHGPAWLRGNLEYAFDVVPLYLFFQDHNVLTTPGQSVQRRQTVYGGSITPLVVKWNFTSGKRIVPFVAAEGSAIFTTQDVPAGDTSVVNFGSGIASGVQFLRGAHRAFSVSGHLMHISNASLGNHNPGINIALQLRLGYQWWR